MEKIVSRVELSEDPALPGEILNKAESLFVAFQTGDFPYVLPFNHVWLDGRIYIHCALEGRKIDVLRRDGRVGFSTAVDVCIIREKSTTHFRSLCGTGRVSEVTDTEEKRRALDAISLRFDALPEPEAQGKRVLVLEDPEKISHVFTLCGFSAERTGRAARTRNRKKVCAFWHKLEKRPCLVRGKSLH